MLRLMDSMTDKPDWNKKIYNDDIVSKWRKEATAVPDSLINERAFDWCVEEAFAGIVAFGLTRSLMLAVVVPRSISGRTTPRPGAGCQLASKNWTSARKSSALSAILDMLLRFPGKRPVFPS